MVRCKFICTSKETLPSGSVTLSFIAVSSGSPENDSFFEATPSGTANFYTVNEQAAALFEAGSEYYVDFSLAIPAPVEAAPQPEPEPVPA